MSTWRLLVLIVVAALLVEGMLVLRVWMQATAQPMDSEGAQSLFDTTDVLAAPAALFTGEEPLRESGVVDYTLLVSIEAYVVIALLLIVFVAGLNGGWNWIKALWPVQYPDFMVQQMKPPRVRRVWQPASGLGARTTRHYVVHAIKLGRAPRRTLRL